MQFMLDVETTGLNPNKNAITSLALVPFDYRLHDPFLGLHFHAICYDITSRKWDDATKEWRKKNNVSTQEYTITNRFEAASEFTSAVADYLLRRADGSDIIIWAKPIQFDCVFLNSYFDEFEIKTPVHYRNYVDLRSFILGTMNDPHLLASAVKEKYPFAAHDALQDCRHQIQCAWEAWNRPGKYAIKKEGGEI